MHFCIAATKYYKSGGSRTHYTGILIFPEDHREQLTCSDLGRWLRALSPSGSLSDKADEVQDHIVQIRYRCEELLNKNVDIIKRSNMGKFDRTLHEL